MKIDKETTIYLVTDPTPDSEFEDVYYETTLNGIELQVLGFYKVGKLLTYENPTIYTYKIEANKDAFKRLEKEKIKCQK
jgi:hypothetical protein